LDLRISCESGIGQVRLLVRRRPRRRAAWAAARGGLSWPRGPPSCSRIPALGLGLGLQPRAGGVELLLQGHAPGNLGRQRLRIAILGIGRLGLSGQRGDVGGKLVAQRLRPVVAQRAAGEAPVIFDQRVFGLDSALNCDASEP
jgi:hypothetical protein